MNSIEKLLKETPELGVETIGKELEVIYKMQAEISYVSSVYKPTVHRKLVLLITGNLSTIRSLYAKKLTSLLEPQVTDKLISGNNYQYNINFEIGKAIGNFIDLMSATNIQPDDILNYYETLLSSLKLADAYLLGDNILGTAFQYGRHCNVMARVYNNPEVNLRPAIRDIPTDDDFFKACRILNEGYKDVMDKCLLDTSFSLIEAYKLLPKSIEGNFDPYQNWIMESWLQFIKLLDLLVVDNNSFGRLYSVYYQSKITKINKDGKPGQPM